MKAMLETKAREVRQAKKRVSVIPTFLLEAVRGKKIGVVNMEEAELAAMIGEWEKSLGAEAYHVLFDRVSSNMEWKDLFPEWIDEEEENDGPSCPEIPLPDFAKYNVEFDTVVARLPCRLPEERWARDVGRLQAHLVAANMAAKKGKRDGRGRVRVVLWTSCRPMPELFRCDDIARGEGEWWMLEPEAGRIEEKVQLPVGSCMLALPLWVHGNFLINPFLFNFYNVFNFFLQGAMHF